MYLDMKDYEKAIQDFDTAIELNPSFTEAYASRGMGNHQLKNYGLAANDYEKYLELSSDKSGSDMVKDMLDIVKAQIEE